MVILLVKRRLGSGVQLLVLKFTTLPITLPGLAILWLISFWFSSASLVWADFDLCNMHVLWFLSAHLDLVSASFLIYLGSIMWHGDYRNWLRRGGQDLDPNPATHWLCDIRKLGPLFVNEDKNNIHCKALLWRLSVKIKLNLLFLEKYLTPSKFIWMLDFTILRLTLPFTLASSC